MSAVRDTRRAAPDAKIGLAVIAHRARTAYNGARAPTRTEVDAVTADPTIAIAPAAASTDNDALFAARAALKLAARQRRDADAQVDHLRHLIDRLERRQERKPR